MTKLFRGFFESEKAGGLILVFATIISLAIASSSFGSGYIDFWEQSRGSHSLSGWINDGLMAIFFLLIGLELEREVYIGELSKIKNAALPLFGALGGMLVPAGIYLAVNSGTNASSGAGIPMATDIAFAVGILSLLGNRVPIALKIFLTALAVIDDLGAIIVIAVFYTKSIAFTNLVIALGIWASLFLLNRLKVYNLIPYLIGGIAMWYFMLHSGIHATITGVILAFVIPFGDGSEHSPSHYLQEWLHKPVAFLILPLFALANTCVPISLDSYEGLQTGAGIGIICGLLIGKPLGIWLFSFLASKLKLCALPEDIRWSHIIGAGFLGGIGFTMSIFITLLAFEDSTMILQAKFAILIASLLAGAVGFVWLKSTLKTISKP